MRTFLYTFTSPTNNDQTNVELSIMPSLNNKLIPPHARADLVTRGIDLDNFTPLTKDEMLAHLD